NDRNQREVIKEPVEGQAKEIKTQVDAKQWVVLADGLPVAGHLVLQPVVHAPLSDYVSNQQNAKPDEPAESYAEAVQRRKLDDLTVDPIAVPVGESMGDQQV